jgi:hypothetical protein
MEAGPEREDVLPRVAKPDPGLGPDGFDPLAGGANAGGYFYPDAVAVSPHRQELDQRVQVVPASQDQHA